MINENVKISRYIKKIIIVSLFVGFVFVLIGKIYGERYEASIILYPNNQSNLNDISGLVNNSILTSIVDTGGNKKVSKAIAILKSRKFFDSIKELREKYNRNEEYYKFIKMINSQYDKGNNILKITIKSESKESLGEYLNQIVKRLDDEMRERDYENYKNSIIYLKKELENVNSLSVEKTFYSLIEENNRNLMLVNIRNEYAFEVIDYAINPSNNNRYGIYLLFLVGVILSILMQVMYLISVKR